MNDIAGVEVPCGSDDCFSCGAAADSSALLHDGWTPCTVDGAIHTSASRKSAVCCVDDRIGCFRGDITNRQDESRVVNGLLHTSCVELVVIYVASVKGLIKNFVYLSVMKKIFLVLLCRLCFFCRPSLHFHDIVFVKHFSVDEFHHKDFIVFYEVDELFGVFL